MRGSWTFAGKICKKCTYKFRIPLKWIWRGRECILFYTFSKSWELCNSQYIIWTKINSWARKPFWENIIYQTRPWSLDLGFTITISTLETNIQLYFTQSARFGFRTGINCTQDRAVQSQLVDFAFPSWHLNHRTAKAFRETFIYFVR